MPSYARVQLPEKWEIPYEKARIDVPKGLVIVEMIPPAISVGLIQLPDSVSEKYRPDVGVVIGVGPGPDQELSVGDMVIPFPKDGHRQTSCEIGYSTGEIRTYGRDQRFAGESRRFPWQNSIPLTYNNREMKATADNVLIRRQPQVETQNGILLPESQKYVPCEATIVDIGPKAHFGIPVAIGSKCNYTVRGVMEFGLGGDPDLAVIKDMDINFIYKDG